MQFGRVALMSAVALVAAACSSGSGSSAPPAQTGSASSAATTGAPSSPSTRIEVQLTDALRIEPATITVPAGVPVTFVVTNAGAIEHEFYLGDQTAQDKYEQEMQSGGMVHESPNGISLAAGETKELTYTFKEPGETLAGCHVAGHYPGGMKATIEVTG